MLKKIFLWSNLLLCAAVVVCSVFLVWQQTFAQEEDDDTSFRLMVFGDSLSSGYRLKENEGYTAQLQNILIDNGLDNVKVINAAVAGNTTADGLARLDDALAQHPHAVILELGANDLLKDLSIAQAEKNLSTIIETFQANDVPVMLIGIQLPLILDLKGREQLNKVYKDLAKKYNLTLYPHFLDGVLIKRLGIYDLKYMQEDTVHPTAEGVQIMVQKTFPVIKKFLMSL